MGHAKFICLALPPDLRARLIRLIRQQGEPFKSFEQSLHMTFVFLGHIDPARHRSIAARLGEINAARREATLTITRTGALGRQTVAFLHIDDDTKQTQADLAAELGAEDAKEFVPHISLGRGPEAPGGDEVAGDNAFTFPLRLELR